ncbi:MAG: hypothetical protein Q9217_006910 [Psora testacea]
MVPKEKYPAQAAQLAASTALGSLVGPLIGGAISQDTTWRWVFLLNGALLQSRMFGGALGLAIASNVLNNHLRSSLASIISAEKLDALLQSTASIQLLPPETQRQVLAAFSDGYNLQMKIMTGFAGAQLLTVGLLWRKNQISVVGEKTVADGEARNLEKTDGVDEPLRTT